MIKQFFFKLFTFKLVKVKWLQVLLYITNYIVKRQSFVYTQLNSQSVLFLKVQFNVSYLFAHSLNI